MRAARRADAARAGHRATAASAGRWRWSLRAAAAGWRIDEVRSPTSRATGRSKVTGTVRGTLRAVRDMAGGARRDDATLARHRQGARARARRRRGCTPPLHARSEAAALAEAALRRHAGGRGRRSPRRRAASLVLDGAPGAWLPAGLRGRRRSAATGSPSGWPPRSRTPAARRSGRHGHAAGDRRELLDDGAGRAGRRGAALGPRRDGGYWGIGLRGAGPARSSRACR